MDWVTAVLKFSHNTQKASGPDYIPAFVLYHCATEIAPILTVIFSQSLNTVEIPSDWLRANVVPIFKKGDRHNPSNYRPISLTSICCKVMKHILCHSIMKHLEDNHILSNFQHGFRPPHSCETQLITLIEEIHHATIKWTLSCWTFLKPSTPFPTLAYCTSWITMVFIHDWLTTCLTKRT